MGELKPTYGNFTTLGIVTGLNESSFTEGQKDYSWAKISFGVKVSNFSFVYVELMGVQHSDVKLIYRDPITRKYDKENVIMTSWGERYYIRDDNYNLHMPIRINLKNQEELLPYDAVFYLKENLKDGDLVFIRGSLQYSEYENKTRINYSLTTIEKVKDVSKIKNKPVIFFEQECVYIDSQRDHEKLLVNTYLIKRNSGEIETIPYTFTARNLDIIKYLESEVMYGSLIKIHGKIHNMATRTEIDGYPVVTGLVKELEIKGGYIIELEKYNVNDLSVDKGEIVFLETESSDGSEFPF